MTQPQRHPENVAGPFYVERDCCRACEAPCYEAPDLMSASNSSREDAGCFFRKQPATSEEVERACNAVSVSCTKAVRYGGDDPGILRRLYESGDFGSCDSASQQPSHAEQLVINAFFRDFRRFRKQQVHWTYVRAVEAERIVVALCHGASVLAIFEVQESTQAVSLIKDDAVYRPSIDSFKRQEPKRKNWFRWHSGQPR